MYSQFITKIQEIIYYTQIQNYHESGMRFRSLLQDMQKDEKIEVLMKERNTPFFYMLQCLLQALEVDDMILVSDILQESLIPFLKEMIDFMPEVRFEKYQLEMTSSGYYTLKNKLLGIYLHSNVNPMEEARVLLEKCYNPTKEKYAVWGLGLGYHIWRLYEIARGAIEIHVFEEENQIMEIVQKYGVLQNIVGQKIVLHHDLNGEQFADYIAKENPGILLHFPSIKKIENPQLKDIMQKFFMKWNGTIQYKTELQVNYRSNCNRIHKNTDELRDVFREKTAILVAAGPSLDKKIDYLREAGKDKIIVVVTTVLKKLLDLGIVPNYAVVMDSQKRTIKQIEGIEDAVVPMIIDSTSYWEFADRYKGEKYLVCQKGYYEAEEAAKKNGNIVYETGGSVTTLALDILLKSGIKEVEFVGVDLAFANGITHATNTMDRKIRDTAGLEQIISVNGGKVYTDILMKSYLNWIEDKIKQYPEVLFYNLSDCGAEISGTIRK